MSSLVDLQDGFRGFLTRAGKPMGPTHKGALIRRRPERVDAVVLHQTACVYGLKAGKDARNARALEIPAHALAFRDGTAVFAHPLETYLYHANSANARSLGLEIEGRYPGSPDDPRTPVREDAVRGEPTPVTELVVETACFALSELVRRGRALGMPLRYLLAHRQYSASRRADPGWELWARVALAMAGPLDLLTMPEWAEGGGKPIPVSWDALDGHGRY